MRFVLLDPEEREFSTERWCYLGGIDDWVDIGESGKLPELAPQVIPTLGTDEFFELF
jgi:hypothetical protein